VLDLSFDFANYDREWIDGQDSRLLKIMNILKFYVS